MPIDKPGNVYVPVVDDDENLCRSFARLLRAAGMQPITYLSAEAFLADTKHLLERVPSSGPPMAYESVRIVRGDHTPAVPAARVVAKQRRSAVGRPLVALPSSALCFDLETFLSRRSIKM